MSLLRKLVGLLSGGASGAGSARELEHPYFGRMRYFEGKDQAGYWEAEVPIAEPPGKASVTLNGLPDGPTPAEEAFCREALADLDALFDRCREAFAPRYEEWAQEPMPADWRGPFELDGISVPPGGDDSGEWEVCYFVEPANHWFTAHFASGEVESVAVDG